MVTSTVWVDEYVPTGGTTKLIWKTPDGAVGDEPAYWTCAGMPASIRTVGVSASFESGVKGAIAPVGIGGVNNPPPVPRIHTAEPTAAGFEGEFREPSELKITPCWEGSRRKKSGAASSTAICAAWLDTP